MRLFQKSHPVVEPARDDAVCAACGKEIEALTGVTGVDVVVNLGGSAEIAGRTADPVGGVICETCHRTWCTDCWIPMLTGDTDVCTACGTRLVVRTTAHLHPG